MEFDFEEENAVPEVLALMLLKKIQKKTKKQWWVNVFYQAPVASRRRQQKNWYGKSMTHWPFAGSSRQLVPENCPVCHHS